MIRLHGTDEQRRRLLPRLASAEIRAAFSMSEPHAGSDVQAIRTTATRDGDDYVLDGQKMWVTNALARRDCRCCSRRPTRRPTRRISA